MKVIKDLDHSTEVTQNATCTNHTGGNYDPFTGGGMQCGGSCKD